MNKEIFLRQLEEKLSVLPEADRLDALEYYEGYISNSESEDSAIAQLGTPASVASMIIGHYAAQRPASDYSGPGPKKSSANAKTLWIVLLALFALPVGLPLVIAAEAIVFAILVTLVVVPFSLGMAGLGLVLGGVVSLFTSPLVISHGLGYVLYQSGAGLILIGVGIILIKIVVVIIRFSFYLAAKFVGKISIRRGNYA